MQELEKILEEIDKTIARYEKNPYIDEKITDLCYGMNLVKDIIRKHLSRENTQKITRSPRDNKRGECSRRKWYVKEYEDALKEDGVSEEFLEDCRRTAQKYKKDNDGWRPAEELMPEKNKTVLVCQRGGVIEVAWHDGYRWKTGFSHAEWLWDVIAWRPLPDPYRPERSNDEKE